MKDLIESRATTHGAFDTKAKFIQHIKSEARKTGGWGVLEPYQQEALDNVIQKMGRILFGDAAHDDHWDDMAGYSILGKGSN